ncbi:hypothetical protein [Kitasatospora cathayae]|uniref:PASTA domain-containing protein n=1 Tax=Kitasatospora cathayae TaxID=3004092 RepID=A0ABY7QET9_9ACTN|nr:hypothetical protein [Kitasatospora sp. HUAS 3-15]WBP90606.1 hypothetical protein O1G21_35240 [Kitasatospora sp. HUAS 3-15]
MESSQQITPRRKAAVLSTAAVLSAAVLLGAVGLGRAWEGDPFPVADPAATARHLNDRAVTAYDALALPQAPVLEPDVGTGIEARPSNCRRRGLAHFGGDLSDSPPLEPRTAVIAARFTLRGVTHQQAAEGVQRARQALTEQGWTVGSYQEFDGFRLQLNPPDTAPGSASYAIGISYTDSTDRLAVGASSECIRYPGGTSTDDDGRPADLPSLSLPAQVRRP